MIEKQINRSQKKILKSRILEPRKFIQVILGPRQVGKTTMVLSLLKEINIPHQFASADNVSSTNDNWIGQLWETVRMRMKQQEVPEMLLVIDEIQKIPNWSEAIKQLWDEDSRKGLNLKIILLMD